MATKYSHLKILHYPQKIESLPADRAEILPPLHVRVKPTNACNHRCRYCAYLEEGLQLGQDMNVRDSIPREKMLEIVDDFIEMGVNAITFSGGGEPLVYPHIVEVLRKLEGSRIKFATLTNGALLEGEKAEIFARAGTWVRLSMDGWDDESYRRYRGCGGEEYTRIMRNIQNFRALGGKCVLGVSLIIDQENAPHVYEMIRRLKDAGVVSVKASPCIVSNDGTENNRYHKPIFDGVKGQILRAIDDLQSDDFEIFNAYHELEEKFTKKYSWCPYIQIMPVVAADQNVYSCHDKAYNLDCGIIGSLKEQRFKDFWLHNKAKFFTINPARDCNHHCAVNNMNRAVLDYLNIDPEHLEFV